MMPGPAPSAWRLARPTACRPPPPAPWPLDPLAPAALGARPKGDESLTEGGLAFALCKRVTRRFCGVLPLAAVTAQERLTALRVGLFRRGFEVCRAG